MPCHVLCRKWTDRFALLGRIVGSPLLCQLPVYGKYALAAAPLMSGHIFIKFVLPVHFRYSCARSWYSEFMCTSHIYTYIVLFIYIFIAHVLTVNFSPACIGADIPYRSVTVSISWTGHCIFGRLLFGRWLCIRSWTGRWRFSIVPWTVSGSGSHPRTANDVDHYTGKCCF